MPLPEGRGDPGAGAGSRRQPARYRLDPRHQGSGHRSKRTRLSEGDVPSEAGRRSRGRWRSRCRRATKRIPATSPSGRSTLDVKRPPARAAFFEVPAWHHDSNRTPAFEANEYSHHRRARKSRGQANTRTLCTMRGSGSWMRSRANSVASFRYEKKFDADIRSQSDDLHGDVHLARSNRRAT